MSARKGPDQRLVLTQSPESIVPSLALCFFPAADCLEPGVKGQGAVDTEAIRGDSGFNILILLQGGGWGGWPGEGW